MTTSTTRHTMRKKTSPCQYSHRWQALFEPGAYVCLDCGLKAYCPRCRLTIPNGAHVTRCPKHREE